MIWLLGWLCSPALAGASKHAASISPAAQKPSPPAAAAHAKLVALTFDDGPHLTNTPRILAILRKHQVRATFFVVGKYAQKYPGLIRRELAWGHTVGNHGLTHTALAGNPVKLRAELAATQAILVGAGARPATLFRPPYGAWDRGTLAGAAALGYSSVLWTVDPQDWSHQATSASIARAVLGAVRPGAVILLHDGGGDRWKTVAALPAILQGLRARGYTPVPLLPGGRLGLPVDLVAPKLKMASLAEVSERASGVISEPPKRNPFYDPSGVGLLSSRVSAPLFAAGDYPPEPWLDGRVAGFSSDSLLEPARLSYTFSSGGISTLIAGCFEEDCLYRGRLTIYEGLTPKNPRSVLYWMERSQRAEDNPALRYAVERANRLQLPLVAYYALDEGLTYAGARTMTFALQGLRETAARLRAEGVHFVLRREPTLPGLFRLVQESGAGEVVGDRNYVGVARLWREEAARELSVPFTLVDSDVAVPVREMGSKQESWERLRPRFSARLPQHLTEAAEARPEIAPAGGLPQGIDLEEVPVDRIVSALRVDQVARPVRHFRGGTGEARARVIGLLSGGPADPASPEGKRTIADASGLSPYFRWGQLSPRRVVLEAARAKGHPAFIQAYVLEAVGKRELAWNYAYYGRDCEGWEGLPEWGRETLIRHNSDPRPIVYHPEVLEQGQTCDELWNVAQKELLSTGVIHDCLRGYWAKKLLEWTPSPEEAHRLALGLYGKYALDAGDPWAHTAIASAIGGLHDHPTDERPIYGVVPELISESIWRQMDVSSYIAWVKERCREMGIDDRFVWPEEVEKGT